MSLVFIKRKFSFAASHRLHCELLSEEENKEIYGKCNNPNGHGHNYTVILTLKGTPEKRTGMFINLAEVSDILQEHIGGQFDHKNLDLDTDYFINNPSTAENIAIVSWGILEKTKLKPFLHCVEIIETENNSALYYGN